MLLADPVITERRRHSRLSGPFPAMVRNADLPDGPAVQAETVVDNISAGGLYMRLARRIDPGASLFVVVHFTTLPDGRVQAPRFAIRGIVQRAEVTSDGECGVALRFTRHRAL